MGCGGSVGEGYGPMIVANRPFDPMSWDESASLFQERYDRLSGTQDLQS